MRINKMTDNNGMPFITDADMNKLFATILPLLFQLLYSKNLQVVSLAGSCIKIMSNINPMEVGKLLITQLTEALDPTKLIHVHKLPAVMTVFASTVIDVLEPVPYAATFLREALSMSLPGIDANDVMKTLTVLRFYISILRAVPLVDATKKGEFSFDDSTKAKLSSDQLVSKRVISELAFQGAFDMTSVLEDWGHAVLQKLLNLVPTVTKPGKGKGLANQYDSALIQASGVVVQELFSQMS